MIIYNICHCSPHQLITVNLFSRYKQNLVKDGCVINLGCDKNNF